MTVAGNVTRGRELIAQAGSVRLALRAAHPDTGGCREDLEAVLAARDTPREAPAVPERFVLRPPGLDLSAPFCASGLDSGVELALLRIGSQPVLVTVFDPAKSSWRARWSGEARTASLARLMFVSPDDAAVPYPPIAIHREKLAGAVYFEADGRGELRIGVKGGHGYIVAGDVEDDA